MICTDALHRLHGRACLPDGARGVPRQHFGAKSPNLAYFVSVNSPWPGVGCAAPPARPQASKTGAFPGARQGLNLVQSSAEPAVTWRFNVRYLGLLRVAFMPLPQRSLAFGFVPPLAPPSHSLQPMVIRPKTTDTSGQRHTCVCAVSACTWVVSPRSRRCRTASTGQPNVRSSAAGPLWKLAVDGVPRLGRDQHVVGRHRSETQDEAHFNHRPLLSLRPSSRGLSCRAFASLPMPFTYHVHSRCSVQLF